MNWISASAAMFVSSIIYYLLVKKAQMNGIDSRVYMMVNYFIPSLLFYFLGIRAGISFIVPVAIFVGIAVIRGIVNYLASLAGWIGMKEAPNAGYSVIIQKSYSVFTAVAAIFLFGSELTPVKYGAIIWTVFCAMLLSVQRGKKISFRNYRWLWYSLVAFFGFGFTRLMGKYYANLGVPALSLLFWSSFATLAISAAELARARSWKTYANTKENALVLLFLGLSVTLFYYFLQTAELAAPNIGYVNTINLGSNAVLTLVTALIFRDSFSWKRFLAVLGVCAGIIILVK